MPTFRSCFRYILQMKEYERERRLMVRREHVSRKLKLENLADAQEAA